MLSRESCSTVKIEAKLIFDPSAREEARARFPLEAYLKPHEQIAAHERMLRSKEVLELAIGRMKELISSRSPSYNNSPELAELQVQSVARAIEVQGIPDTAFLLISYYHPDPEFASDMANVISWAYKEYRQNQFDQMVADGRRRFVLDLQTGKAQIASLQKEVAELKERGGIIDPDPDHDVVIKMGVDQNAVAAYLTAKSKLLKEKKIMDAAEMKLANDRIDGGWCGGGTPILIWEKAEPPMHRTHANLRRLWKRLVSKS